MDGSGPAQRLGLLKRLREGRAARSDETGGAVTQNLSGADRSYLLLDAHREPAPDVIDMHFHADRPDDEGPPGGKACAPYPEWAPRDPGKPIDAYIDWFTVHPTCAHVLSAPTDGATLRDQGIAQLKRYNVLALAGGNAAVVEDYRQHGDGHILPSVGFGSSGKLPRDRYAAPFVGGQGAGAE